MDCNMPNHINQIKKKKKNNGKLYNYILLGLIANPYEYLTRVINDGFYSQLVAY